MQVDIEALKAAAEAATPGPWQECRHSRNGCSCGQIWATSADMPIATAERGDEEIGPIPPEVYKANAKYIAAANPIAILALIAELEQLRREKLELARRYSEQKLQEARLDGEILRLHRMLAGETLRANQGWERYEQANADRNTMRAASAKLVEQEPAMWYEAEESARGADVRDVIGGMIYSTRLHTAKPDTKNPVWPLYAAPQAPVASLQGWISVNDRLPECSKKPDSMGIEVMIYPRPDQGDSTAFYGRRQTKEPNFYKYGAVLHGVTHWQPLPPVPDA